MQDVLQNLIRSSAAPGDALGEFIVPHNDLHRDAKLGLLTMMEGRGIVQRIELGRDAWQFSEAGRGRVRCRYTLEKKGRALCNREGITAEEATTFELLNLLSNNGWQPQVKELLFKRCRLFSLSMWLSLRFILGVLVIMATTVPSNWFEEAVMFKMLGHNREFGTPRIYCVGR
jgi:hypothetical protein